MVVERAEKSWLYGLLAVTSTAPGVMLFLSKDTFTITTLTRELKKEGILPEGTSETSLWRVLHKIGFRYKTTQRKMYARRESLDILCKRIRALRALKQYREEGRQVVYLDETWFTTRMSHNKEWVDTTQPSTTNTHSRQVTPGDGERVVVVAAGTNKGFIEDSFLCYTAKNSSGDYHGEMNAELFQRWLTTKLLPSLEEPSVLVIDNAPYHSRLTEESHCPTTGTKKDDLIKWLQQRNITYPPYALRPELLKICKENRPPPRFTVDNTIRLLPSIPKHTLKACYLITEPRGYMSEEAPAWSLSHELKA
ncbi:uncharacterized protein [Palaemon carinicauda]|uniref:uncharacterized protein n=1 Tax=Palaemon carinicauda TaxID=392227 RepID=UPI0035B58B73